MSDNETRVSSRTEQITYWPVRGTTKFGEFSYDDPLELDVRIEKNEVLTSDPTSNTVGFDYVINVGQDVDEGGIVYLGPLTDLEEGILVDTYKVTNFEKIPDVKGRKFDRYVMARRDRRKEIEFTPLCYNDEVLCHGGLPLFYSSPGKTVDQTDYRPFEDDDEIPVAIVSTPASTEAIDYFKSLVDSAAYLTKRQTSIDNADNHAAGSGNQSALQFPYYNQSIYCQSEVNAAEVCQDSSYIDRMFEVWDAGIAGHNLTISIDSGESTQESNGFSNPATSKGATTTSFKAVENAQPLWMFEWGNAIFEAAVRINEGTFATASQKQRARNYAVWVTTNVAERLFCSSYWSDLNVYVERASANNNNAGGTFHWDDKFNLCGTLATRINYWLPQWGFSLPAFMTSESLPVGRPRFDFRTWYRHMIGESLANGESTTYHGFPVVNGSRIIANGSSYHPPNANTAISSQKDDVFHDARRLQWWRAVEETQQFLDSGTKARHELHGPGFVQTMNNVIHYNGSCWDTYYRSDATDRDELPDGGKKPVWHWGSKSLDSEAVRDKFQKIIDGATLSGTDTCYLQGYDAVNLANIAGWVALAHYRGNL